MASKETNSSSKLRQLVEFQIRLLLLKQGVVSSNNNSIWEAPKDFRVLQQEAIRNKPARCRLAAREAKRISTSSRDPATMYKA
jgi:hypothetical protein